MALIKCPHCGEEISDRGVVCPKCQQMLLKNDGTVTGTAAIPTNAEIPMPIKPQLTIGTVVFYMLLIGVGVLCLFGLPNLMAIIGLIIDCVILWAAIKAHRDAMEDYDVALRELQCTNNLSADGAYKQRLDMRAKELDKIKQDSDKRTAEKQSLKYNHYKYKCPMCGSNKIMNISTAKKMVSSELFGLGSKTIGKNYFCEDCKYIW